MSGETYLSAGVDRDAAETVKGLIHGYARSTHSPQVLGEEGRFAGLFHLAGYRNPVLVSSTDSVGTKLKAAVLMDSYESLGVDLVNLNVGDILTSGAKPIFFLDYIAMKRNVGGTFGGGAAPIPEPAGLCLLALGGAALLRRRRS